MNEKGRLIKPPLKPVQDQALHAEHPQEVLELFVGHAVGPAVPAPVVKPFGVLLLVLHAVVALREVLVRAEDDGHVDRFAVAVHRDGDRVAHSVLTDIQRDVGRRSDVLTVDCRDDVADLQIGIGCTRSGRYGGNVSA